MGWLATFLANLVAGLLAWFGKFATKKVAAAATYFVIFTGFLVTFTGVIYGIISAVIITLPSEYALAMSLVLPSNTSSCISAIISARVCRFAYDWFKRQAEMAHMTSFIT